MISCTKLIGNQNGLCAFKTKIRRKQNFTSMMELGIYSIFSKFSKESVESKKLRVTSVMVKTPLLASLTFEFETQQG